MPTSPTLLTLLRPADPHPGSAAPSDRAAAALAARPVQHDAHVRAAIMSPDVVLPSASLARIGLADSSDHELDMVSWRDVAAEWDLDRETAEALLAEARAGLEPLQPPPRRPASRLLPSLERVLIELDRRQSAPAPLASDRAAVLDCLRVRDLGGDWLGHPSFEAGAHSDDMRAALVRDGLARWDDFGIHITPRGRRAWADGRNALRDLASAVEAAR